MGCVPVVQSWTDFRVLALPAVVAVVLVGTYVLFKTNDRMFRTGAVIGAIAFVPSSNLLITVGFTVAERVLYLPSVGMCIIMARLFELAQRRIKNAEKIFVAVLIVAITMSYQRSEEWRTDLDLYASGLRVCTQNAKVHYNLGKVLSRIGDVNAAEHNYWNAIRLNPNYEHAMNNLANILEAKGRSEEAEVLLRKALRSRPMFAVAWMNLGITLMNQGRHEEALKSFHRSIQLRPSSADCLFNLGNLYQKMKRPNDALEAWKNATV
ncbi:tetratricopeptide repeat protein [Teladorsagia circumcincta]|uniref:Tetratricopeptide repeat protein n=1 Tax=Teladorsagia circumcincta TaxID=45464 RepID=A0A2G9U2N4_TELCI|nr:tetratricopeptide repeat protein [Teladorsagia circumcincta]